MFCLHHTWHWRTSFIELDDDDYNRIVLALALVVATDHSNIDSTRFRVLRQICLPGIGRKLSRSFAFIVITSYAIFGECQFFFPIVVLALIFPSFHLGLRLHYVLFIKQCFNQGLQHFYHHHEHTHTFLTSDTYYTFINFIIIINPLTLCFNIHQPPPHTFLSFLITSSFIFIINTTYCCSPFFVLCPSSTMICIHRLLHHIIASQGCKYQFLCVHPLLLYFFLFSLNRFPFILSSSAPFYIACLPHHRPSNK